MTFDGMPPQTAAAGWYTDPAGGGGLRYFDGTQWTPHLAPAPPEAAPWNQPAWNQPAYATASARVGSDPHDAAHWLLPIGRTGQSIAAGYLGLLGLVVWPLAPFAIVFGIWALARSKQTGLHGRGRAIFAIIAGAIGCLFGMIAIASGAFGTG